MNNEEVMNLLTDMGLHAGGMENWIPDNAWVEVVNKVIAIEREACAKLCEGMIVSMDIGSEFSWASQSCAKAIRARGEK
jgi:hypothetical protein